jgi:hypothetical protein
MLPTVGRLLDIPNLGTRLFAYESGLDTPEQDPDDPCDRLGRTRWTNELPLDTGRPRQSASTLGRDKSRRGPKRVGSPSSGDTDTSGITGLVRAYARTKNEIRGIV